MTMHWRIAFREMSGAQLVSAAFRLVQELAELEGLVPVEMPPAEG